jgi:hypothetical protein
MERSILMGQSQLLAEIGVPDFHSSMHGGVEESTVIALYPCVGRPHSRSDGGPIAVFD